MRKQAIKRKELFILIGMLLGFTVLITLTTIFFSGKSEKKVPVEKEPVLVEGTLPSGDKSAGTESPAQKSEKIGSEAFFLKPSADEVLSAIRNTDELLQQPPPETPAMKVMWPGYFFSLKENKSAEAIVELDVDQSGFGVMLICSVKQTDYPEIKELRKGQKIWVAGEVTAIDPEGTGSVFITVEYIRFDEGPYSAK